MSEAGVRDRLSVEQWGVLASLLLDFQAYPGRYAVVMREPRPLFERATEVLMLAAGRAVEGLPEEPELETRLREAARFFVRVAMLRPSADHYALLGLGPDFEPATLREHYRLLMRLTHPDFSSSEGAWPADAATRINLANDVLASPERRRDYDNAKPKRAAWQPPAVARPVRVHADHGHRRRLWPAVAGGAAAVLLVSIWLWPDPSNHDRLQKLAQAPVAEPEAAPPAGARPGVAHPAAPLPVPATTVPPPPVSTTDAVAAPSPRPTVPPAVTALPSSAGAEAPVSAGERRVQPPAPTAPVQLATRPAQEPSGVPVSPSPSHPPRSAAVALAAGPSSSQDGGGAVLAARKVAAAPVGPGPASAQATPSLTLSRTIQIQPATVTPSPPPLPEAVTPVPVAAPLAPTPPVAMAASAPAAAPASAGLKMADVQPLLGQLLGALQSGRGEQVSRLVDRSSSQGDGGARFVDAYNRAVGGSRVVRLGGVQFAGRGSGSEQLVVDGVVQLQLQSPDDTRQVSTRELVMRAQFASRGGQPVLTQLSASEVGK